MSSRDIGEIEHALDPGASPARQDQGAAYKPMTTTGKAHPAIVDTTPGRMLLAEMLPRTQDSVRVVNKLLTKKEIAS